MCKVVKSLFVVLKMKKDSHLYFHFMLNITIGISYLDYALLWSNFCSLICSSRLELRSSEMKKIISTLRALVEVMEALSKDADPSGVGGLITEEVLLYIILRCLSLSKLTLLIIRSLQSGFQLFKIVF